MGIADFQAGAKVDDYRWPITAIDFEASGIGKGTYPIEAGTATWNGPGTPIQTWSSLIAPTEEWLRDGGWHPESEPIHKISRADLQQGSSPAAVLMQLHRIIGVGGTAFCDGGEHDRYWCGRLAKAAGHSAHFFLVPSNVLTGIFSQDQVNRYFEHPGEAPHRAGPDAVLHLKAFAYGLGLDEPAVVDAPFLLVA